MNLKKFTQSERTLKLGKERVQYHSEHPETTRGGVGSGRRRWDGSAPSFTDYAAIKYETSTQSVQAYLARYSALGIDVLKAVIGTTFDRGSMLDTLALMPPEDRLPYIKRRAIPIHKRKDVCRVRFPEAV